MANPANTVPSSLCSNAFSGVLNLPNANQNYNLFSLVSAIDPNAAVNVAQLLVIALDTNTNNVAIVQRTNMSAMTDGDQIIPTDSRNFSTSPRNGISLSQFFLRSDATNQKVRVHAVVG